MDEIIKGLKELKDAIIYKAIADTHYIDLINSMVARAEKLRRPAEAVEQRQVQAIMPGIDEAFLDEPHKQIVLIAADNATINFFQEQKHEDIPPTNEN